MKNWLLVSAAASLLALTAPAEAQTPKAGEGHAVRHGHGELRTRFGLQTYRLPARHHAHRARYAERAPARTLNQGFLRNPDGTYGAPAPANGYYPIGSYNYGEVVGSPGARPANGNGAFPMLPSQPVYAPSDQGFPIRGMSGDLLHPY
jgi:hypothetical protein